MGAINFSIDEKLLEMFVRELPLKMFFETGTFEGGSLRIARRFIAECHSVELSPEYHSAAVKNFSSHSGVHLHLGESPAHLRSFRELLAGTPTLFWLDAHWCAAEHAAGANSQTPLLAELAAIGNIHPQSVVLIDDARLYLCCPPVPLRVADWPDFHAVVQALLALSPVHRLMVLSDVIVYYPASLQSQLTQFAHEHGADWQDLAGQARKYRAAKNMIRKLNPFQKKR